MYELPPLKPVDPCGSNEGVRELAGAAAALAWLEESMRMSRYVFFNDDAQDGKVLAAAEAMVRSRGAKVVKSLAGAMLLELAPAQVADVAQALPGWRYSAEGKTTRVPERKPLERSGASGTSAALKS